MTWLILNGTQPQCGVYQYGFRLAQLCGPDFADYQEFQTPADFVRLGRDHPATHVLVNYHASLFPWLRKDHEHSSKNYFYLYHEHLLPPGVHPKQMVNTDPTNRRGLAWALPRPLGLKAAAAAAATSVPRRPLTTRLACPVIGSFGFGFHHKGFDRVIQLVQDQFDTARIRLLMPFAFFGDADGHQARSVAAQCRSLVHKPGIHLEISHDFLSDEDLCRFLAENDLNLFLYDYGGDRGCSSVIDFALCVARPIGISNSAMFRHIDCDALRVDKTPLRTLLADDSPALNHQEALCATWSIAALQNTMTSISNSSKE